jgi:hypothetical protein
MSSDTLVLKIEEVEEHNGVQIDTRMFVFYDHYDSCYHVRGERTCTRSVNYRPYSFRCDTLETLTDFLRFAICKQNQWCFTLYNYDDLPRNSDEITYEDMEWHQCISREIAGYDNRKLTRKGLKRILKLLRNVYNPY